jgi:hypothetical protein
MGIRIPVSMPLVDLPVGATKVAFIVNQCTDCDGEVELLMHSVGQISGHRNRQRIELTSRDVTFFDTVPIVMRSLSGTETLAPLGHLAPATSRMHVIAPL